MKYNEILCSSCRTIKSQTEFANGYGAQAGRKVSICKECCNAKLEKYEQRVGKVGAFWLLMAELGIPFIQQAYDVAYHASISIKKGAKRPDLVELYVKKLNLLDMKYDGFWDSDTMLDDILNEHKEALDPKLDLALMNRIWGKYPDEEYAEAYDFLEDKFNEYFKRLYNSFIYVTHKHKIYQMKITADVDEKPVILYPEPKVADFMCVFRNIKIFNFNKNDEVVSREPE